MELYQENISILTHERICISSEYVLFLFLSTNSMKKYVQPFTQNFPYYLASFVNLFCRVLNPFKTNKKKFLPSHFFLLTIYCYQGVQPVHFHWKFCQAFLSNWVKYLPHFIFPLQIVFELYLSLEILPSLLQQQGQLPTTYYFPSSNNF